jgi:hypothetical protein
MLHLQTFKHRKMFKVEQHPAEREGEFWKNLKKKWRLEHHVDQHGVLVAWKLATKKQNGGCSTQ